MGIDANNNLERQCVGRKKSRIRRIAIPILIVLFLLVAAGPYLIPGDYLRQRIIHDLSQQTQSAVTLEKVSLGWFSGLGLSKLTLDNPQTHSLVTIDRIRIPIEPFELIFKGSASFVQLDRVHVQLAQQDQKLDFSRLFNSKPAAFPVQQIRLTDLEVDFTWQDGFQQNIIVPKLEFIFNLATQTVQYDTRAKLLARRTSSSNLEYVGSLTTHGNFKFVQQQGQQCLAGTLQINWQDMNLSILRLERIPQIDIEKLAGNSGGTLAFEIFPDFHFRWNSRMQFDDLIVKRGEISTPGQIGRLTVTTDGKFDPVTGNLTLGQLDVSSSPLKISSKMEGRFDDEDFDLKTLNLDGKLDLAVVANLWPDLAVSLGEKGKIDGPCLFNFSWKGESVGYQIKASVDANRVFLDRPGIIEKKFEDPLHCSVSIHTDQATWPWMVLDSFDCKVGQTDLHASGRLPPIRSGYNLDAWFDEIRRLAEFSATINSPDISWFSSKAPSIKQTLSKANLAGPVVMHLGYTGQEDVGRMDFDMELKETSSLALGDVFIKPKNKKFDLRLQGFRPWQSEQPQMWIYIFGKCGEAEFLTDEQPIKAIWAFSETPEQKPSVDLFADVSLEIRGLNELMACSPRLQREHMPEHVGGTFEFQLGSVLRATLENGGWTPQNARVNFTLEADKTWVDLPETFLKPIDVPLSLTMDYSYENKAKQHELTGKVNWLETQAEFDVLRLNGKDGHIAGTGEIRIGQLKNTLAAIPPLAKGLKEVADIDGEMTLGLKWSADAEKSTIDWSIDGTPTSIILKGKTIKPEAMPATLMGELTLPASSNQLSKTYAISKLKTQLGQSYINLDHGSITLRNNRTNKWDKLFGVEPWMFWNSGSLESFSMDLAGHFDADSPWLRVNPKLHDILDRYELHGYTDFNLETEMKDSLLQTTFKAGLDQLAFHYEDLISKKTNTPGTLGVSVSIWPEADDPNICHFQLAPAELRIGQIDTSCTGGGQLAWSKDKAFSLNDALARIHFNIDNLSQLQELSPLVHDYRAGGRLSAEIGVSRQNNLNHLTGSFIDFDNVSAEFSDRPVMLDGRISFAEDYVNSNQLLFSAGVSSLKTRWNAILIDNNLAGLAEVTSDYFDSDQVGEILSSPFKTSPPSTKPSAPTTQATQPSTAPFNAEYLQAQEKQMEAMNPWRQKVSRSNFLVDLNLKKLRATDPRSNNRYDLDTFRSQINLEHNKDSNRPTAAWRFWSKVSGGLVSGNFVAMLDEENPPLILDSSIDDIRAVDEFKPMVENFFPGLQVQGRLTIIESSRQKLFTTTQTSPNYQVGSGSMIFVDGFMVGKAAPDWVTRIFPGLNFTRYNFTRMYNWFEKNEYGIVHNNMIFLGSPWNIYIEGDSFPDGRIEYEVGVDLLARYESEYWSSVGQGRVPIFITTGKIVAGKMEDQETSYVPPHEVIYRVLVKNNAIAGAYRLLRKNRP
jgi:hypothetical protein